MSNKNYVKVFKAMGNERRFSILKYLFKKKELTVTEIAKLINLSFKSTSRHLAVLLSTDMVQYRQINLNRYFSINSVLSKQFIDFLKM